MSKKEKIHHTEPGAGDGTPDRTCCAPQSQLMAEEPFHDSPNSKNNWPKPNPRLRNIRMAGSVPWQISRTTGAAWRLKRLRPTRMRSAVSSKHYLPILDDLERALATRPADLAWVDGIELIYRKLKSILEAEGLKRIEAEGQMFDPNFHEAISQEPSEDHESGQIIAVVQNGYMLGERVIRPAMVRVAQLINSSFFAPLINFN